jgi:hypothetical protein
MPLSKSKCWYSNNCSHYIRLAVPLYSWEGSTPLSIMAYLQHPTVYLPIIMRIVMQSGVMPSFVIRSVLHWVLPYCVLKLSTV